MMHYSKCNHALQFLQIFFSCFPDFLRRGPCVRHRKGGYSTWKPFHVDQVFHILDHLIVLVTFHMDMDMITLMHFTFHMDQIQSHTQMYLTFHRDQVQSKSHISQIVSHSCSYFPILNPNPRQPMLLFLLIP